MAVVYEDTGWNRRIHADTRQAEIDQIMKEHFALWRGPLGDLRREEFWAEHGGRFCDRCGWHEGAWIFRNRALIVHHLHYRDPTGDERTSTLRGLCTRCHDGTRANGKPGDGHKAWKRSVHEVHRDRYVRGRSFDHQDLWPRKHLEHVTKSLIRRSWWRRALRRKP